MLITDQMIILETRQFNEKDALLKLFSKHHGIITAYLKNARSKQNDLTFLIGNLVLVNCKSKVEDGLFFASGDLLKSYHSLLIFNRSALLMSMSIFEIIRKVIPESSLEPELYDGLIKFLDRALSDKDLFDIYVQMERFILKITGFGLNFQSCVVCGASSDLIYLSPKSGQAVCAIDGMDYASQMLKLPDSKDIKANLQLNDYFFQRYFIKSKNIKPFNYRLLLEDYLKNRILNSQKT